MRDLMSWAFPIGSLFGIAIRVHLFLPILIVGLIARATHYLGWVGFVDVSLLMALLFVTVLLHELGHCFAARYVDGSADEIILWPLGGFAKCDMPHTPWAHFIVALGGPLVHIPLCLLAALGLAFFFPVSYQPVWTPFAMVQRYATGNNLAVQLQSWSGETQQVSDLAVIALVQFFWINQTLFLFNVLMVGIPFDGGRMLQAALWPRVGYHQAMRVAIYAGFAVFFLFVIASFMIIDPLLLALALFTFAACQREWLILEQSSEDAMFGYDYGDVGGYGGPDRDDSPPPPRKKDPGFFQRWLRRRAERKAKLEQEQHDAEERRMDELLVKIQKHGKDSLTDEENRFMKRVSTRYRKH